MKSILGHVGAWAPKAEQVATANYITQDDLIDAYLTKFKGEVDTRLQGFYKGFTALKNEGHNVNAIAPQAAMYLTVEMNLKGKRTAAGNILQTTADVTKYILDEGKVALVPFSAFGSSVDSNWYRLSIGTCAVSDIEQVISNLRNALSKLN